MNASAVQARQCFVNLGKFVRDSKERNSLTPHILRSAGSVFVLRAVGAAFLFGITILIARLLRVVAVLDLSIADLYKSVSERLLQFDQVISPHEGELALLDEKMRFMQARAHLHQKKILRLPLVIKQLLALWLKEIKKI